MMGKKGFVYVFQFPNCFSEAHTSFLNTSYLFQSHYCNARFACIRNPLYIRGTGALTHNHTHSPLRLHIRIHEFVIVSQYRLNTSNNSTNMIIAISETVSAISYIPVYASEIHRSGIFPLRPKPKLRPKHIPKLRPNKEASFIT